MSSSAPAQDDVNKPPMQFIETTSYQRPMLSSHSRSQPPPEPWKQYYHPNGDTYFYNHELRLITPEDIQDPTMLRFVIDAREDHLQCLQSDSSLQKMSDDWELTLSDVTDSAAVIGMHSRKLGVSYHWTEERGLEFRSREYFWSHVAEYPSHHRDLPPYVEDTFVQALSNAKLLVSQGQIFPFSMAQIDQVIERYEHLKILQMQGKDVLPALGWLIGAVMPLDACGRTYSDDVLEDLMGRMHV